MAALDSAAALASEMADLLAQTNGDRLEGNSTKVLRDQAVTLLREAMDTVRDYGKFVFYNDELRLKGYASQYYRRQTKNAGDADSGDSPKLQSEG